MVEAPTVIADGARAGLVEPASVLLLPAATFMFVRTHVKKEQYPENLPQHVRLRQSAKETGLKLEIGSFQKVTNRSDGVVHSGGSATSETETSDGGDSGGLVLGQSVVKSGDTVSQIPSIKRNAGSVSKRTHQSLCRSYQERVRHLKTT